MTPEEAVEFVREKRPQISLASVSYTAPSRISQHVAYSFVMRTHNLAFIEELGGISG
jgi:hypothetical protein